MADTFTGEVTARRYAQDFAVPSACIPFLQTPDIVHMGLNKLDARSWIAPCAQLPHYLHNKTAARHALGEKVYAQIPESLPAQRELCTVLHRHLLRDHPDYLRTATGELRWRNGARELRWPGADSALACAAPLWEASRWIADDVCVLQPGDDGYVLVAASLAAPSYWRLEEKIGRPLNQIHKPVPGFKEKLSAQVARFFDHLKPEYPVWRSNWSVVDSPELLQRGEGENLLSQEKASAERSAYLRVERQSLRRLPDTGAVVFTIRVMINPLEDLLAVGGGVAALRSAVAAMSPEEGRYKSLAPLLAEENGPLRRFFTRYGDPSPTRATS